MASITLTLQSVTCALNGGQINFFIETDVPNTRVYVVSDPARDMDVPSTGYYTFPGFPNGTFVMYARDMDTEYITEFTEVTVNCVTKPVCDLAISNVATVKASGEYIADAQVIGAYTGTVSDAANVRWSIDGITWQVSSTFLILAGSGTLYVRDENPAFPEADWCRDSVPFNVGWVATYGPLYTLDFDDVRTPSIDYGLRIRRRGYTGATEPVCGGESPVRIEYDDSGFEKYEPLKGSKCILTLKSETSFKYLPFFSSDERAHRVDVLKGADLYWRGFVLPEIYNEPFIAPTYEVSITATDGLGSLKGYLYTDGNGNPFTGEKSLLEIVFDCLDRLDLNLPLVSIVDVYEANMYEATAIDDTNPVISDPLAQTAVNTAVFIDEKGKAKDCDQVLRYCLEFLGARIYQDSGKWVVECIDAKRGTVWAVTYNADRSFLSYSELNPIVATALPNTGGLQWLGGTQQLELIPAYKETAVRTELLIKENIVPAGEMRLQDFTTGNLLKGWQAVDADGVAVPYVRVQEGKDKHGVSFNSPTQIDYATAHKWVSPPFRLEAELGTTLYLRLDYKLVKNKDFPGSPFISFELTNGTTVYTNIGFQPTGRYTFNVLEQPDQNKFELIIPSTFASGDYRLNVYDATNNTQIESFTLQGVSLQVLPDGVYPFQEVTSVVTNKKRYTHLPPVKEVMFTDTQVTANYKEVHANYLVTGGEQSQSWHIKGQEGDSGITNLLAANIAYNYSRPSHVLRGDLQGEVSYFNTIREDYNFRRIFMWSGLSIDLRMATYSGTLVELIIPVFNGYRVLETRKRRKLENGAYRLREKV